MLSARALGQIPDVRFHLDLYGTYDERQNNTGTLHLYDQLGDASTIQINVFLQPGMTAYVSERMEQYPRDPSHDPLEQYYVEEKDVWRLGKQFLPFGSGLLFRENVLAARGETRLLFENATLAMAVCDGGSGNQRGVMGRLGDKVGISVAIGDHFGISPTSLDLIRPPDLAPGIGRGWREMGDADFSRISGRFATSGEAAVLLNGDTPADQNQLVWDLNEQYRFDKNHWVLVGFTETTQDGVNYLRAQGHIPWNKAVSIEPLLRFREGRFFDFGLTAHVRL